MAFFRIKSLFFGYSMCYPASINRTVELSAMDFGFATEQEIRAEMGARLKTQRLLKGLTQAALAERAGISVNTLKLAEGKGQCTFETFVRVIMGLGLVDELQPLFKSRPKSIAEMEAAERGLRVPMRAPRARAKATRGKE
jgi:hypothetical protein